ncbi:MAG: ribonuclease T2 [Pseudomonadota bacterium]
MKRLIATLLLLSSPLFAEGERSGVFDYYVLSLSWTPSWCETTGDARGSEQCDAGRGFGFTLHGLWPQYEDGWPSYCRHNFRQATRAETAAMTDIMGTSGLAWHQWKKHGSCAGMSAPEYFELSRKAYNSIDRSNLLRQLETEVEITAAVVEQAFLEVNPNLAPAHIEVTCKNGNIQEARICLSKQLEPFDCTFKRKSCGAGTYDLPPIR